MKNKWFIVPVALLAVFGLIFMGCPSGSDDPDDKPPAGGEGEEVFNLADWLKTNSVIGYPLEKAGDPTLEFTEAGISITDRIHDYDSIDIILAQIGVDGSEFDITVEGAVADGTNMKICQPDEPWGTIKQVTGAGGTYSITETVPATYAQPKVRITTGQDSTVDFTITKIVIKTKAESSGGTSDNNFARTLTLADNFEYGEGYQGEIEWSKLLNAALTKGDVYAIELEFTISRDLEDDLDMQIINHDDNGSIVHQYWAHGSYTYRIGPGTISAAEQEAKFDDYTDAPKGALTGSGNGLKKGTTHTWTGDVVMQRDLPIARTSLCFQTKGAGTGGSNGSGVEKPVDLVFTKLIITKK